MSYLDRIYAMGDMFADYKMSSAVFYGLILLAITLQLASMFVPYYSLDGTTYGLVEVDNNMGEACLGAPSSGEIDECAANIVFPSLAVGFGLLAIISMGGCDVSFLNSDSYNLKSLPGFMKFFETLEAWNISAFILIFIATIFSITSFAFQMGHPVNNPIRQNLAEKDRITYEPGMPLSATAMSCFIISCIIVCVYTGKNIGNSANCRSSF